MESIPISGDSESRDMQEVIAQFDAPAYIRRARGVELALEHLLNKCRAQANAWLEMTKLRLGRLIAVAGDWSVLEALLADGQLPVLKKLHTELAPKLRVPPEPTSSKRVLRRALHELVSSLNRFNERWRTYLEKVDCSAVDQVREGYNRYYVIEKACALRSDRLAGHGFVPLKPMTREELFGLLPPLPVPVLRK
jgi:hypothetical protein